MNEARTDPKTGEKEEMLKLMTMMTRPQLFYFEALVNAIADRLTQEINKDNTKQE